MMGTETLIFAGRNSGHFRSSDAKYVMKTDMPPSYRS